MMNKIKQFFSDHDILILTIVASCLSVASFLYYYNSGLITAYGDSRGHLNIARRVFDSLTPGAAQLGGYWLPLLHILMLPTIWNDFMWQSGLSGSIPSMVSFVLAVVFMYKLVLYIAKDKFSAIIASIIIMLNVNLLYMQSTPMTESLFICTVIIFMYFFYKWFQEKNISHLILAAIFLILSSLNRYEGWGLVIAANVLLIWDWVQSKFSKKIEGVTVMFATLSFLGIFMWLLWGAVIFHDPLEFMNNALSAGNRIKTEITTHKPTGDGNMVDAISTNVFSIFHTSGYLIFIFSAIGVALYLARKKKKIFDPQIITIFLLTIPFLFDILTVYTGKVPVEVPELSMQPSPNNYFNIRYSLYVLPFLAFMISYISKRKIIQTILLIVVLLNYFLIFPHNSKPMAVLRDIGVRHGFEDNDIAWFRNNYDGGLILASSGENDPFMFETSMDQKKFITEGTYQIWDASLKNPAENANWIVTSIYSGRDQVDKFINKEKLSAEYEIVYEASSRIIYKLKNK